MTGRDAPAPNALDCTPGCCEGVAEARRPVREGPRGQRRRWVAWPVTRPDWQNGDALQNYALYFVSTTVAAGGGLWFQVSSAPALRAASRAERIAAPNKEAFWRCIRAGMEGARWG